MHLQQIYFSRFKNIHWKSFCGSMILVHLLAVDINVLTLSVKVKITNIIELLFRRIIHANASQFSIFKEVTALF